MNYKGYNELENKDYDYKDLNDIQEKRYPNGGKCDICGHKAEYLHFIEENICRLCIVDLNKRKESNFNIDILYDGICICCGRIYQIPTFFGKASFNACRNCMKTIGINFQKANWKVKKNERFKNQ